MKTLRLLLTCEHAVNTVPDEFTALFSEHQALNCSHRGIDLGALAIAQQMQIHFQVPLICATTTRLLVDCNRSHNTSRCFSEITKPLPKPHKQHILDTYYHPYRQQVESCISDYLNKDNTVLHLSVHSFTPELHGHQRNVDFALLYDPKRPGEKEFARRWQSLLLKQTNPLRVRMNYPYRGISDGFTTALRRKFNTENYLGIELESNQLLAHHPVSRVQLIHHIIDTLSELITSGEHHGKIS